MLHDEGEGDRHHGQIGAGDADRGQGEQGADRRGERAGAGERRPEIDALEREDRHGIGADGVKADMPDGDLSGEADQDVEADTDDGGQRDQRQHERGIALAEEAHAETRSGEDGNGCNAEGPVHRRLVIPS